jgi:hypothetical protein
VFSITEMRIWDPPRFRGPADALAFLKETPDTAREVLRRAEVFRRQAEAWAAADRSGVPLLTLPEAPGPCVGACLSCGLALAESGWRCGLCRHAVEIVLGVSPLEEPGP